MSGIAEQEDIERQQHELDGKGEEEQLGRPVEQVAAEGATAGGPVAGRRSIVRLVRGGQQTPHDRQGQTDGQQAEDGELQARIEYGRGGDEADARQSRQQTVQCGMRQIGRQTGEGAGRASGEEEQAQGQAEEHAGGPHQRGRRIAQPEVEQGGRTGGQQGQAEPGPQQVESGLEAGRRQHQRQAQQPGKRQMLPGQGQTVQQTGRRELIERLEREELAIAEEQGR